MRALTSTANGNPQHGTMNLAGAQRTADYLVELYLRRMVNFASSNARHKRYVSNLLIREHQVFKAYRQRRGIYAFTKESKERGGVYAGNANACEKKKVAAGNASFGLPTIPGVTPFLP